jgi:VIT1/CCC1 family predicted Fe2+/Mn2+ transporter
MVRSNSNSIQGEIEMHNLSKAAHAALIGILCGTLAIGTVTLGGCNSTQVEADIQKVIALLPTAIQIAESILNIVSAAEGNSAPSATLLASVKSASGQVQADLTLANSLVAQYQSDLVSAPAGVLGQIDAVIADAQQNIGAILSAVHIANPTVVAAVNSAIASVQTVILALIAVLPASAPAALFPKLTASLQSAGIQPGSVKVAIPTPHAFAKSFNNDARIVTIQQAHPSAQIKVSIPHARILGLPLP